MKPQQLKETAEVLKACLRAKFLNYKPETSPMPFHTRLLGRDRMALFSFIQSLNTTFGTSIFEPVAVSLAQGNFERVEKQAVIGSQISEVAQAAIQGIINDLSTASIEPDIESELAKIVPASKRGVMQKLKPV